MTGPAKPAADRSAEKAAGTRKAAPRRSEAAESATVPEDSAGAAARDHTGAGGRAFAEGVAADPRVQAGLEHLQRAAHEVIAASRALLDVAEELVEDPKAAGTIVDLLGSFAAMARPVAGRVGVRRDTEHDDEPGGEPPVQRIPVS